MCEGVSGEGVHVEVMIIEILYDIPPTTIPSQPTQNTLTLTPSHPHTLTFTHTPFPAIFRLYLH